MTAFPPTHRPTPAWRPPTALLAVATSGLGVTVLALGPLACVLAAPLLGWDPAMTASARWVFVGLWSPFVPVGVAALALQDFRDQVAPGRSPLRRLGALVRQLAVRGPAPVVTATWANLAGLVGAVWLLTR